MRIAARALAMVLRELIVRRRDTASVFGFDTAAFEGRWRESLRQRYGLS